MRAQRGAPQGAPQRRPTQQRQLASIQLPAYVPQVAVLGPKGVVVKRLRELTGADIVYEKEDHCVNVRGSSESVKEAAQLLDRNVRQFLLTRPRGYPYAERDMLGLLAERLDSVDTFQLIPYNRPLLHDHDNGMVFRPASERRSGGRGAASAARSQPPPPPPAPGWECQQATDELATAAMDLASKSPVDYDDLTVTFNLGKGVFVRRVEAEEPELEAGLIPRTLLTDWANMRYQANRFLFDANLEQDAIKALDRSLLAGGFKVSELSRSVSLQMRTSIPWVDYHATFGVGADGKSLSLQQVAADSYKACCITVMSTAEHLDFRARVLGKGGHLESDPVVQAFRRHADDGSFELVNNTRVTVPAALQRLDLVLSTARVKVMRTYRGTLPPPAAGSVSVAHKRGALPPLGPVGVEISVTAVVDNTARKRLEVIASSPDLSALLRRIHTGQQPGTPDEQYELVRLHLLAMYQWMQELCTSVPSHVAASAAGAV